MAYTIEYYIECNKRLKKEVFELKGREGQWQKEIRELKDRNLQEKRELDGFRAQNRAMKNKLKLATKAIEIQGELE